METGKSSTRSLEQPILQTPEQASVDELAELYARTGLRESNMRDDGIASLGKMSGVKSNHRNLRNEDEAVRKNIEAHEQKQLGVEKSQGDKPGEEMDIMAARDVHITYGSPQAAQSSGPTTSAVAPAPSTPSPVASGLPKWLGPALIGTALGGPVAAVAASYLMNQPQDQTNFALDLLPDGVQTNK